MATLKDVAKLANVDVSTVSRALNDASYVHPETKKRILEAVEQLSYKQNLIAKSLKEGKKHTIGIVVPSINISVFGEIVQHTEIEARKYGYSVMICNTKDDPNSEEECLKKLRNGLVDGILIASTGENKRLLDDIKADGVSIVQIIRNQNKKFSSIVADYYSNAYDGVRYLHNKGCKNIGFISGSTNIIPYKEREKGYKKAIRELNLEEMLFVSDAPKGDYFSSGYNLALELLKSNSNLDGIMVAADLQGLGVLRALRNRNINCPGKIKVISLSGHSIGSMLETTMTSMEIPLLEIAKKSINMIIEDIEATKSEKPSIQHLTFSSKIVERESS